jgi:hypothetical protein
MGGSESASSRQLNGNGSYSLEVRSDKAGNIGVGKLRPASGYFGAKTRAYVNARE